MKRSFAEQPTQLRLRSGVQQFDPYVFRAETGCSEQGRVALLAVLSTPLKVQVGASIKQRVNERDLLSQWQSAFKQHVRNEMQRMGEARVHFSPAYELVGARRI